jgi:uncharacterized protein
MNRIAPSAELTFEGSPAVPWSGHFLGREGWGRFFQTLAGHLSDINVTMQPFAVQGDHVAATGRYQGTVRATGQPIDSPLVHLWTVQNGLVVSCHETANSAAEAAACGAVAV